MMANTLKGKIALVTGGSRGIGAATAKRLAQEGAVVALSYVSGREKADAVVKEIENHGGSSAAFKADQADPVQIEEMVKAVVKRFGHLDILVVNAGIFVRAEIEQNLLQHCRDCTGSRRLTWAASPLQLFALRLNIWLRRQDCFDRIHQSGEQVPFSDDR